MPCLSPLSLGGSLWCWQVLLVQSHSATAKAAAIVPIAMTMPSPWLTPELELAMAAPCTLRILGRWAGPTTCEAE